MKITGAAEVVAHTAVRLVHDTSMTIRCRRDRQGCRRSMTSGPNSTLCLTLAVATLTACSPSEADQAQVAESAAACEKVLATDSAPEVTIPPSIRNREAALEAINTAYPADLRLTNVGGQVQLSMLVDTAGLVVASRVRQGSGNAELDSAAVQAAASFRFSPPYAVDVPTCDWITRPIRFTPDR